MTAGAGIETAIPPGIGDVNQNSILLGVRQGRRIPAVESRRITKLPWPMPYAMNPIWSTRKSPRPRTLDWEG